MVGFLVYDYDEKLAGWSFSRFMIDIKYQNKGFGAKALERFLEFFRNKFPNQDLYTSVEIDNEVTIKLYEKYGFTKKDSFEYKIEETTCREFRMLKEAW
ncbi:spermine/spermidine acetyltransferase [Clostridium putrefaciens]|uniref:Spermine/spermidine acetyltransferase n=1 Tax=Clostridium putrefaciens TaxID=99675 RepID=A0A381J8Y9_9CLOT|nr:spermine/spermidine acetyltransferase [Clostridium putrefaciens]